MLDKFNFIDVEKNQSQAVKALSRGDGFFEEHYDLYPVLPESVQIEMIAQAGGVLVGAALDFKKEIVLGKIDFARYEKTILPPAQLVIDAWVEEKHDEGARIQGEITCDGQLVSEASILLIYMDQLDSKTDLKSGESIVFSDNFLNALQIREHLKVSTS